MQDHASVERTQAFRRRQQRVNLDFTDPTLLYYQITEPHQELLEFSEVNRFTSAHAAKRRENLGLLHKQPGEGGVQRRQPYRMVLIHLDQLASTSKQQNRSKLRINAGAEDQLV